MSSYGIWRIPVNRNGMDIANSDDGDKGVGEWARDFTMTPRLHGELDVGCPEETVDVSLKK